MSASSSFFSAERSVLWVCRQELATDVADKVVAVIPATTEIIKLGQHK